jgi:hypothetical protein
MPPLLDRFLGSLPAAQFLDGPLPDLNLVVDALMEVEQVMPQDLEPLGPPAGPDGMGHGGMKREYDAGPGMDAEMMYGGAMGPGKDVYRQRARQKARMGPSGGGDG